MTGALWVKETGTGTVGWRAWLPTATFSVRDYGAVGDSVTNDRASIQAALDAAAAAGGGTVVIPPGHYKVQITTAGWPGSATLTYANAAAYMGLVVNSDNIRVSGYGAKLTMLPYGGDADTNWYATGNGSFPAWRGGGIWITGGADFASRRTGVIIEGLEIDGTFTYTGLHSAASPITGDGWDVSHKGIWCMNSTYHDFWTVRDCHLHNFAGEVVYAGGSDNAVGSLGSFQIAHNHVHDTNGSAISVGGRYVVIRDNDIHTTGGCAVENAVNEGHHVIDGNRAWDTLLDAYGLVGYDDGNGGYTVCNNLSRNSTQRGIGLSSAHNTRVYGNLIIDPTLGGISVVIGAGYPNDTTRHVDIFGNTVLADTKNPTAGVVLSLTALQAKNIRVFGNTFARTVDAEAGGFKLMEAIAIGASANLDEIDTFNNYFDATHGESIDARAIRTLLTGTTITTVAMREFPARGLALVSVALEVVTAATDVTVTISHLAANMVTDTTTALLPLTSKATGLHTLTPLVVPVESRGAVRVRVTAGTANQVYVSATVREA